MAKAVWKGVTLAASRDIAHVEGNAYFPKASVNWDHLREHDDFGMTFCHWKGFAAYFDVVVDGDTLAGAAWRYDAPYEQAELIRDHVAFWKGVEVIGGPEGRGYVEPSPSLRGELSGWEALCWLLRHPDKSVLTAADVRENTGIAEDGIGEAWQVFDVQRYAKRYRWTLEGGNGAPVRLVQAAGKPVDIG